MSDELDELEKSWDESKYDPNIGLREMWDREEKYYAKKEEEEAKKREKERKEEEERRREEEKIEKERIEKILKEMQNNAESHSTTSARSYPSTSSSVPVSQNHSASDSATQPCYGPMTIGDYIGSCIGLIIVGAGAILPILFLIYIRTIIRAVVWLYHHFFCIITAVFAFILIGYAALTIIDYAYAAMYSVKKNCQKNIHPPVLSRCSRLRDLVLEFDSSGAKYIPGDLQKTAGCILYASDNHFNSFADHSCGRQKASEI